MRRPLATIAVVLAIAAPRLLHAQVRAVNTVTAAAAQRALAAAEAEARKNGWLMSIAVVDPAGELVAFLRMDGAPLSSVDIARSKGRTAARFRRPTRVLDSLVTAGRTAVMSLDGVVAVEGGVPIIVNGEVVGAVGVSGAAASQDAQAAQAGATAAAAAR